ncbi:MAG TPA: trehalase family glycosidase [Candidatus Saccharimonadia bacterium]|nr:trehalase family glycosidase [Candidatus Saccharimonadia bacterium]
MAHTDPQRARRELLSLTRGQWDNGMMPHMIYGDGLQSRLESMLWGTAGLSPKGSRTSGISQPPVLAIATEHVAHCLEPKDRGEFITSMLPVLVRFHEWIYRDRDPRGTGLAVCLHSWECGMDDTPYWTQAMDKLPRPPLRWRWLREYRPVRPEERATPRDLQHMLALAYTMKRYHYEPSQIMQHSTVVIQDIVFNSVLAAANESLDRLADTVGQELNSKLRQQFSPTRRALEELWDDETDQYYSRDYQSGRLLRAPTVATFMPLFAGTASPARAERLRQLLVDEGGYNVAFPLPSVPTTSRSFEPRRYWRGPVWINMNWFVVVGLERYGFMEEAQWLRSHTIGLVSKSGFREYFNPETGDGLGAVSFSWSAALTLDLLARQSASAAVLE